MFNYASVNDIKALLKKHDIAACKRFGQNFMLHEHTRRKFMDLLPVKVGTLVWEIGPGLGAISSLFLQSGIMIRGFEIDRGLILCLRTLFGKEIDKGTFSIVKGDVQKTLLLQQTRPAAIMGNLPYNIASGLLSQLITQGFADLPMLFTFQKEVAERICARPGEKSYGILSILCQYAMKIDKCGIIPPNAFFPVPEVHSCILRFTPLNPSSNSPEHLKRLEMLLGLLFRSRRKTIANNIRQGEDQKMAKTLLENLEEIKMYSGLRAECLSPEDIRKIMSKFRTEERIIPIDEHRNGRDG